MMNRNNQFIDPKNAINQFAKPNMFPTSYNYNNFNGINQIKTDIPIYVYVGNLPPQTSQAEITQLLASQDGFQKFTILKDHFSGESRSFGFATFKDEEKAKKCVDQMNYCAYKGRELKIALKRKPEEFKQEANVLVTNLSETVNSKQLENQGKKYGEVLSAMIKKDNQGTSLGYGFIQFSSAAEADHCIAELNGKEIGDCVLGAQKLEPKAARRRRNNIYVKNFPGDWSEAQVQDFLQKEFSTYGEIDSTKIFKNNKLGAYFAFVCFKSADSAKNAVDVLNNLTMPNSELNLYVNFAMPKLDRKKMLSRSQKMNNKSSVFLKGIEKDVTEAQLKEAFAQFGEIVGVSLRKKQFRKYGEMTESGFAYINFTTPEEAEKAIVEGKLSAAIRNLIDFSLVGGGEYIFAAMTKKMREEQRMKESMMQMGGNGGALSQQQFMQMYMMYMQMMKPNQRGGNNNFNNNAMGGANNFGMMNPAMMMNQGMNNRNFNNNSMMQAQNLGMGGGMGINLGNMQNQNRFNGMNMMNNGNGIGMNSQQMAMNPLGQMNMQSNGMSQAMNPLGAMGQMNHNQSQSLQQKQYGRNNNNQAAPQQAQSNPRGLYNLNWIVENRGSFEKMGDEEKKKSLGTLLYPLIKSVLGDRPNANETTPKVTGMLIDLEALTVDDILESIRDRNILTQRVTEALELIREDMMNSRR